jgi:hypothetical protein
MRAELDRLRDAGKGPSGSAAHRPKKKALAGLFYGSDETGPTPLTSDC